MVLSGGRHPAPGAARVSEWHDPDRFLAGLDLFCQAKSVSARPASRGAALLAEAQHLGIPEGAMASTPPVVNTAEEAVAIRRLLEPSKAASAPPTRILLVTSAFHMRRSQRLFERQGFEVEPFPVDFQARGAWAGPLWRDPTQWFPSAGALDGSSRALRELLGRLIYRAW